MHEPGTKNGKRLRVGVRKQPGDAVVQDRPMEPVLGDGPVRRIVFDDDQTRTFRKVEPEPEAAPEPEPEPEPKPEPKPEPRPEPGPRPTDARLDQRRKRREWDIDEIHREVDRLHRNRTWGRPLALGIEQPGTIYTTTRGAVREAQLDSRPRRLLYVSEGEGSGRREQRFVSSMVDRVIRGVGPGSPPSDRLIERALRGTTETVEERTETTTRRSRDGTTTTTRSSSRSSSSSASAPTGRAPRAGTVQEERPSDADEPANTDGERSSTYQDQCAALTQGGVQCRNSSRIGSKYCSSHRNYRARSVPEGARGTDTLPAHPKAGDTQPNIRNGKSP